MQFKTFANRFANASYAHLYPDATMEEATSEVVPGPWKEGFFRLFLSHTKANKQLAGKIRERLLEQGIDAYVAHDMIEPTKEWMDEIENALRTCDATAAVLSEDFVGSQWCDQEIGISIGRRILIIAVRQGADPHGFIGKFQAIPGDATPNGGGEYFHQPSRDSCQPRPDEGENGGCDGSCICEQQ